MTYRVFIAPQGFSIRNATAEFGCDLKRRPADGFRSSSCDRFVSREEVVLILQIGSLGDTVISLPSFREIARRHPNATRYLLTNFPIGSKMVPAEAILMPTGVIVGSIEYPMPLRHLGKMLALRRRIRELKPSILYYLLPERHVPNLLRHYIFFKLSGIRQIRAMPWSSDRRLSQEIVPGTLWESEASRLLRNLDAPLRPPPDADRDLSLSSAEKAKAEALVSQLGASAGFVAISVGGKVPLNDWGDQNWMKVLRSLSGSRSGLGAVFVGSADERPRNEALAALWEGPTLNTCGQLTPRETAALIARAQAFLGHDTGTLHLAAAVDTPVVGIFSARNHPGIWFSDRPRDRFFYDHVRCAGCRLTQIDECANDRICMASHEPAAVVAAAQSMLQEHE